MQHSYLILTDSGGVQEEAPSLKKPILVLRSNTERPEAVESGAAALVGTEEDNIFAAASALLTDKKAYDKMICQFNPYGDGQAAQKIVQKLEHFFATEKKEKS